MKSLLSTIYLDKSLNDLVNDIMMLFKEILFNPFILIAPNLMQHLVSKKNTELEYS